MGQLGFPQEKIEQIERDTPSGGHRSIECLRSALFLWAASKNATYEDIIRALRGPLFDNEELARTVEKYVSTSDHRLIQG